MEFSPQGLSHAGAPAQYVSTIYARGSPVENCASFEAKDNRTMLCGLPIVVPNSEAAVVEAKGTRDAGRSTTGKQEGSFLLDLFWPLPLGLLAMGALVSSLLGLWLALR